MSVNKFPPMRIQANPIKLTESHKRRQESRRKAPWGQGRDNKRGKGQCRIMGQKWLTFTIYDYG